MPRQEANESPKVRGILSFCKTVDQQFEGGLLHTKSFTVGGEFSLFGSLNLDPRSFHLNFEITLAVYDADFTREFRRLQLSYMQHSCAMDLGEWQSRSLPVKLAENSFRLLGPLP